MSQEAQLPQR